LTWNEPGYTLKILHSERIPFTNAQIPRSSRGFAADDTFSVVLDRNEFEVDAVRIFYAIKDDPAFPHRHRLETCTPGESEKFIGLQPADFVAYETFRLMQGTRNGITEIRHALNGMLGTTGFMSHLYGKEALEAIKPLADAATCKADYYIAIPYYGWVAKDSNPA
jgi:hypothetical protein